VSFRPHDDLLEDRARLRIAVDAVLGRLASGELPATAERPAVDLKEEAGPARPWGRTPRSRAPEPRRR
jgi:hypothetical protein